MKYIKDLLTDGKFRKSFTGAPVPLEGYAVTLSETIETANDNHTLSFVEAIIEDYKERYFEELNQMGAFYDVTYMDGIIRMAVVVYIEDKQQAINYAKKYNYELN